MDEAKQEEVPEIGAIEAFEYEIARNTFVAITEKNKEQYVRLQLSITGTQGEFSPVLLVLLITQQSF